jgi:hypothetical protein
VRILHLKEAAAGERVEATIKELGAKYGIDKVKVSSPNQEK